MSSSAAEPLLWTIAVDRAEVQAGNGFFVARVRADISAGYHLYSLTPSPGGPIQTSITLAPGQPFVMEHVAVWPPPVRLFDPKFEMETEYHVGEVLFDVRLKAESQAPAGPHDVVLNVEYQLCDDQTCLRPEGQELRAKIQVKAGGTPASGR